MRREELDQLPEDYTPFIHAMSNKNIVNIKFNPCKDITAYEVALCSKILHGKSYVKSELVKVWDEYGWDVMRHIDIDSNNPVTSIPTNRPKDQ